MLKVSMRNLGPGWCRDRFIAVIAAFRCQMVDKILTGERAESPEAHIELCSCAAVLSISCCCPLQAMNTICKARCRTNHWVYMFGMLALLSEAPRSSPKLSYVGQFRFCSFPFVSWLRRSCGFQVQAIMRPRSGRGAWFFSGGKSRKVKLCMPKYSSFI